MRTLGIVVGTIASALAMMILLTISSISVYQWTHPGIGDMGLTATAIGVFSLFTGVPIGAAAFLAQALPKTWSWGGLLEIALGGLTLLFVGQYVFSNFGDEVICFVVAALLAVFHGVTLLLLAAKNSRLVK